MIYKLNMQNNLATHLINIHVVITEVGHHKDRRYIFTKKFILKYYSWTSTL